MKFRNLAYYLVIFGLLTANLFAMTYQGHYRWRNDDGSETAATWATAEDVDVQVDKGTIIRLRLEVYDTLGLRGPGDPHDFFLAYSTSSDATTGTWVAITTSSSLFQLAATSHFADGDETTGQLTHTNGSFATGGACIESSSTHFASLAPGISYEYEYSITPTTSAEQGTTYYFALFDGDGVLDVYATLPGLAVTVDGSLPVTLSRFDAASNQRGVALSWTTSAEVENQGYIISRRTEDTRWSEIASFTGDRALVGEGSTTRSTEYAFLDDAVRAGVTYSYMLSDVDYRGNRTDHTRLVQEITHTPVEEPNLPAAIELLSVYPNPFNPTTTLTYSINSATNFVVLIYDLRGNLVWSRSRPDHPTGEKYVLVWSGVDMNQNQLPTGLYLVNIRAGHEWVQRKVSLVR